MFETCFLISRTPRHTKLSGLSASDPSGVFKPSGVYGNTATAGMPNSCALPTSSANKSTLKRSTPGIDDTASRLPNPSTTKIGQIRSSVVRRFSCTIRRNQSADRLRRIRVEGNVEHAGKPVIHLCLIECLRNVPHYIVNMLNANRQTHIARRHARSQLIFG